MDGLMQKDVTPLLMHWSHVLLALTHRYADGVLLAIFMLHKNHGVFFFIIDYL